MFVLVLIKIIVKAVLDSALKGFNVLKTPHKLDSVEGHREKISIINLMIF